LPQQNRAVLRKLFLFYLLLLSQISIAQSDTCGMRISLLTCSPGEELYATFGHTAIRVQHAATATDEVFNYGMFEFNPDFYPKFIRGQLLYSLGVEPYPDFAYTYQYERRSVAEQELRLSCRQKEKLWMALRENATAEKRHYKYDFLFDNCTTRARDMIAQQAGAPVQFQSILPKGRLTFRNMLHTYLDRGGQHWSKLGIDLVLGARLDRQVSNYEAMFLPDYLMKGIDKAQFAGMRLATPPATILQMPAAQKEFSLFRPVVVFTLLLLVVVLLSGSKGPKALLLLRMFDRFFFFALGLAGLFLLFMWFGTDHRVCRDNLNLLWALPTHLAAAFFAGRSTDGSLTYFKAVFWGMLLLLAAWAFLPQQLNIALLPLILLIAARSYHLSKPEAYAHRNN
jgi:hypothetical protein